jgi:hypothetical protein
MGHERHALFEEPGPMDEPTVPGAPLRLRSILLWQTFAVVCGIGVQVTVARGAPVSLFLGAFLMTGSLVLSQQALRFATRSKKRPFLAMFFFFLKLALFLGLAIFGLSGQLLGAMSFAAGATTLPMAIVADTCYPLGRQ